jgi:prepilin-type N-terminal cleavage/methylation domain-containing protein
MLSTKGRGFTLIEVVVTAAFIGVVVLALNDLFVSLRQINREANNYTIATEAAQQLIEQYRNTPYSSIVVGTTDVTSSALGPYPSLLTPRSATVTVTLTNASGLKTVDVGVSYKDRTGTKNVQMETVVSYKGVNR